MTRTTLRSGIDRRANTDLRIAHELTDIVEFLIKNNHVPNHPAIKTPDLIAQCPQASYQRIERLVHEMGMVQKFKQGPNTYLIHTRKNEIVNGMGVSKMVNEELKRVSQHAKQNSSIRNVVGQARNKQPRNALNGLMSGSFAERRDRLERIVDAIRADSGVTQGNYGKIIFRTPANLYRATPLAIQLFKK